MGRLSILGGVNPATLILPILRTKYRIGYWYRPIISPILSVIRISVKSGISDPL